jgi:hypothetical protein
MIVACLALKGLSMREIHEDLIAPLGVMQLHKVQLSATFAKRTFFLQVKTPLRLILRVVSMVPTKPSCPLSTRTYLRLRRSSLD